MLTVSDLSARARRLEQLTRGLAKEVVLWKECNDPLLYLERKAYLEALQSALGGLDNARMALVGARQRLLDGAGATGEIRERKGAAVRGRADAT